MTAKKHLTIMIMEDNRGDVYLLKQALRKAQLTFTALVFEDGESAFVYLEHKPGPRVEPLPDLAILDLHVPRRDGLEVLEYIREDPRLRDIPVVVLSSLPKRIMRDRAAQADCYITKPTDLDGFLKIGETIRDCVVTGRVGQAPSPKGATTER